MPDSMEVRSGPQSLSLSFIFFYGGDTHACMLVCVLLGFKGSRVTVLRVSKSQNSATEIIAM